jgi:hypothetical protein
MEHLLTSQPIFNISKENNIKPKNRVLYKFQISEGKNGPNYLRKSYFIKLNSLPKRFKPNSKNITPAKTNEYFPLIKIVKHNNTLSNTSINEISEKNANSKNINLKLHKKYKSKDEIIKSNFRDYNEINNFNIIEDNNKDNNNIAFTEAEIINNKTIPKDNNINIHQTKERTIFREIMEKCKQKELKSIKLCKIDKNKNIKNISLEPIKSNSSRIYDNSNNNNHNPTTINSNNIDYNENDKIKVKLGSKYSVYDLSHESISRNKLYNKLNIYFNDINKRKININRNKINLTKIDLHKLKLKKYHDYKIQKYKVLIDESIKDVLGVKNNCMNWINELKEKYSDLYKGLGIEK